MVGGRTEVAGTGRGATSAVQVYWRPGCPFCMSLRRGLRRSGLPVNEINIWVEPAAAARVREATGGDETVPTVVVADRVMVNPSMAQVEDAVRRHAPQLYEGVTPAEPIWRRFWPWLGRRQLRR